MFLSMEFADQTSWLRRIIRYGGLAQSRFNAVKHDEGTGSALAFIVSRGCRYAASHLVRSSRGLVDRLVATLPLPNVQSGVLFIGYLEGSLGLGESLRGLVRSVAETELRFALYPFNVGVETRLIGAFMPDRYDLRRAYQANVIEMAADQVPRLFNTIGWRKTNRSYNILRTYWELPHAPLAWRDMLGGIHELWVPNEFVRRAFRDIFVGPITVVPPCVEVQTGNRFERAHFGMDRDRFYFIFSFDYFSFPYRKNPLGVVRAFRSAFPDTAERVGLVIKSTGATDQHPDIKSAIMDAALQDQRIQIIDRTVSRDEMLSLIRESDCYISLHRSEGFGLGMAEAMACRKPVIGTDYSGNTEFLSDLTGFPVACTLRGVQPGEYIYSDGQCWAEPDEAAAAVTMRRVFYDQNERQRRATAGKVFVESHYGRDNVGRIAVERLQHILASKNCAKGPARGISTNNPRAPT
jgi:glycosyltransferase involved in cell wall biosynthesis